MNITRPTQSVLLVLITVTVLSEITNCESPYAVFSSLLSLLYVRST